MIIKVEIDKKDLFEEYGLYLTKRSIPPAEPNIYTLEIPGRNGKLDYTDFYGKLSYQNRKIEIELQKKADRNTQELKYLLEKEFNGQEVQLSFSDDYDHYWQGRINFTENDDDTDIYKLSFTLDAYPFKFHKLFNTEVR